MLLGAAGVALYQGEFGVGGREPLESTR